MTKSFVFIAVSSLSISAFAQTWTCKTAPSASSWDQTTVTLQLQTGGESTGSVMNNQMNPENTPVTVSSRDNDDDLNQTNERSTAPRPDQTLSGRYTDHGMDLIYTVDFFAPASGAKEATVKLLYSYWQDCMDTVTDTQTLTCTQQ